LTARPSHTRNPVVTDHKALAKGRSDMPLLTRKTMLRLSLSLVAATALTGSMSFAALAKDKIVLIVNGALGDKSFFDSANHGMELIKAKYGDDVETRVLEVGDDRCSTSPSRITTSSSAAPIRSPRPLAKSPSSTRTRSTSCSMPPCPSRKAGSRTSTPSTTSRTKAPISAACSPLTSSSPASSALTARSGSWAAWTFRSSTTSSLATLPAPSR